MKLAGSLIKKAAESGKDLFWKTQIKVMRGFPPFSGFVSMHGMGAENSRKVWLTTLMKAVLHMPHLLLAHCRDKRKGRVILPRVSIPVTFRCTLNCDKCIVMIPDLTGPRDIPLQAVLDDLRYLIACVDQIYTLTLMGGEALMHPNLDEIIRFCATSGKFKNIVLQSNGTIVPNERVLTALKEAGVTVKISDYPQELQPDVSKVKSALKKNGIAYTHSSGTAWHDLGVPGELQEGSARRRFDICVQQLCGAYVEGKLALCGQSALLLREGLISDCEDEYIDLRKVDPAEFRERYRCLLKKRVISACAYCLGDTYRTPKIPVAVQRNPMKRK